MARLWVVLGDALASGGSVVSGSPFTDIDGRPVARVGDKAVCAAHGPTSIATGDATLIIDGQPVARDGDSCACGCKLVAGQQMLAFLDDGSSSGAAMRSSASAVSSSLVPAAASSAMAMLARKDVVRYDEAIRFVGELGKPLAKLRYKLELATGETREGVTNSDGTTSRVETPSPVAIVKATLTEPAASPCCAPGAGSTPDVAVLNLNGITTHGAEIGVSVANAAISGHERVLTVGEISMAQQVFGDSVDYAKVKVHNHGYWLLFGFQDEETAVTPNGEMYFPRGIFKEDFSSEALDQQHWFIHEMAHVWQYQLGYHVKLVRGPRPNMSYAYQLTDDKKLCDYNMEMQGEILADYFLASFRQQPGLTRAARDTPPSQILSKLEAVLADFLAAPADQANLPNTTK